MNESSSYIGDGVDSDADMFVTANGHLEESKQK